MQKKILSTPLPMHICSYTIRVDAWFKAILLTVCLNMFLLTTFFVNFFKYVQLGFAKEVNRTKLQFYLSPSNVKLLN